MGSVNRAIILGRLGKDPVVRTAGQTPVCNFSVATSERRSEKDETTWHDIVVFGKSAEACGKYLAKGSEVHIEGRIQIRDYETKAGEKRRAHEIVADRVTFIGGKRTEAPAPDRVSEAQPSLDEIPF